MEEEWTRALGKFEKCVTVFAKATHTHMQPDPDPIEIMNSDPIDKVSNWFVMSSFSEKAAGMQQMNITTGQN